MRRNVFLRPLGIIVPGPVPQLVKPACGKNAGGGPVQRRPVAQVELEKFGGVPAFNVAGHVTFEKTELGPPDAGPDDLEIAQRQIGRKAFAGGSQHDLLSGGQGQLEGTFKGLGQKPFADPDNQVAEDSFVYASGSFPNHGLQPPPVYPGPGP